MKILLISSYIFGYMDFAVEEMKRQGHEVEVFYFENESLDFQYKSIIHKARGGISKLMGNNAKKNYREKSLKSKLKNECFDFTLMIHGQYLNDETHQFLKSITKKYVAYFFDSLTKMPEQKKIIHHFDKVFSYEPQDCEKFGFEFITNFIPSTEYKSENYKYKIFNIGGMDSRFSATQSLANYLNDQQISFRFLLYHKNKIRFFEHLSKKLNIHEVLPLIKDCKIMLDIQRENQSGLTFRVFEAIGNNKKLITTNRDIVNYDFYNAKNIFILDLNNIKIPEIILESEYQLLSKEIINQYVVKSWVERILV